MDEDQKPKVEFIDFTPSQHRKRRDDLLKGGVKPKIIDILKKENEWNPEKAIERALNFEKRLIDREASYRKLTIAELRSLAFERGISAVWSKTGTHGTIIYQLLKQDYVNEELEKGGLTKEHVFPRKIIMYERKDFEVSDQVEKTVGSRKKAGKSTATEKLFDEMVDLFPTLLTKQTDNRYSLARTKKLKPLGEDDFYSGEYQVFYATQREATGEIFLRWMKQKARTDRGECIGDHDACLKAFNKWSKEAKFVAREKALIKEIGDKQKAADEKKIKHAAKTATSDDPGKAKKVKEPGKEFSK